MKGGLLDVVEHAEMVEKELDAFITRRASREPDPDTTEASYAESARRYHSLRRREALWDRLRWHEQMLEAHTRTFQELLDRHQVGVRRCEALLGLVPRAKPKPSDTIESSTYGEPV